MKIFYIVTEFRDLVSQLAPTTNKINYQGALQPSNFPPIGRIASKLSRTITQGHFGDGRNYGHPLGASRQPFVSAIVALSTARVPIVIAVVIVARLGRTREKLASLDRRSIRQYLLTVFVGRTIAARQQRVNACITYGL